MELLPEGQKNTATEVAWEDQQRINQFSSLITERDELSDELKLYEKEQEYFEDLSLEIELLDEDEKINYKLGDSFFLIKVSSAISRIEQESADLTTKVSDINTKISLIDTKLSNLKKELYGKFGKNINLER
jgi:prefoldin subunit 4